MGETTVSKSQFKAKALELLRAVESQGRTLVVTDRGRPVARVVPYETDPEALLASLRETVVRYDAPTEPVDEEEWEAAR